MFYSFFLLLALACLGEFTIFNFLSMSSQQPPLWLLYVLPLSFVLGVLLAKENKGFLEKLRRYIQLETLFIIGMIFYVYMLYTTKNHPLVNFGYFMIYSMSLSACFIFREFSTYLYLLSCSLLFGVSQLYDVSDPVLKAGFYLAALVFCIVIHNDYMNYKYIAQSNRNKMFPFVITIVSVVFGVMIMTWMTFATPQISNYLDSVALIRSYFQKKQPPTPQTAKNIQNNTQSQQRRQQQQPQKQQSQRKAKQNKENKQANNKQTNSDSNSSDKNPIANHTQVSLKNDLKFGDVDFSNISPRKLFEVELATETLGNADIRSQDLYWKLGHLDTYDAQNGYWYLRNTQQQDLPRSSGGWIALNAGKPRFKHNKILQLYTLYAPTSRLYYLTQPGYIDIKRGLRDRGGNIFPETQGNQYQVVSYVATTRAQVPYSIMNVSYRYTSVPRNIQVYRNLAKHITRNSRRPYDKVKSIERYLQKNYTYDLKPGIRGGDATYQFLFKKRRGYCQHFASAMVLLLRSIDIPARVAVGCHGGIWDTNKQAYVVSSIHRHAWVEVPFQVLGWTKFDPVPVDDPQIDADFTEKVEEFKRRENIQSADNIVHNDDDRRGRHSSERTQNNPNKNGETQNDFARNDPRNDKNSANNNQRFGDNGDKQRFSDNNQRFGDNNQRLSDDKKRLAQRNKRQQPFDDRSENAKKQRRFANEDSVNRNNNMQRADKDRFFMTPEQQKMQQLARKRLQRIRRERQRQQQLRQQIEIQRQKRIQRQKQLAKKRNAKKRNSSATPQQKKLDTLTHNKTAQQKMAKTSNNTTQKSSKQSRQMRTANGIITFIKNMTIFCVSFVLILIFCYVVPQVIKTIRFLIKVLFSKSETQQEAENIPKWGKMIAKVLAPKKKVHTELGKIIHEYTQLSKKLETFGLHKQTHQTPTEYLHFLQKEVSPTAKHNMQMLTQLFLKVKYSPYEVDSDDVVLFKQYCETIFSDIRRAS
ncbi:DUF4129 domain-containing transglutaminase family protein [Candidatus Uabimicrobium amorphum]|uniref:Transglutaminase n=1 Tax=Uabimicrobium amorphum TaxID=2596890 RepID=A0A5S9F2A1_UABAM|nr:transglutaminase domain-containing protein [Candidatus Uabimicrobium amorphum]BBM82174.1 transglutaminase [Candidatus Uabimicrobium amorphum]